MRPLRLAIAFVMLSLQAIASPQSDQCAAFASVNLVNIMHAPMSFQPDRLHEFGDFSPTVSACKEALKVQPGNPTLLLQHARALIADGQQELARGALRTLVDQEQPAAVRLYGVLVFYGDAAGHPPNPAKAAAYYKLAADLGDPVAPLLYAEWLRLTGQPEQVFKPWFVRAAATGYGPGEFFLYRLSVRGEISGISKGEQLRLLQSSAGKKFPWAMIELAQHLRDGTLPPDPAHADALDNEVRKIQPKSGLKFENYEYQFG